MQKGKLSTPDGMTCITQRQRTFTLLSLPCVLAIMLCSPESFSARRVQPSTLFIAAEAPKEAARRSPWRFPFPQAVGLGRRMLHGGALRSGFEGQEFCMFQSCGYSFRSSDSDGVYLMVYSQACR